MSLWSRQPSQRTLEPADAAAGRSTGGFSPGDAARRGTADARSDARRGDGADDDRQRSQRLAAAKQFDLDGQIG